MSMSQNPLRLTVSVRSLTSDASDLFGSSNAHSSRSFIQMIVENLPVKKHAEAQLDLPDSSDAAPLEELPPSFERATEDRLLPNPPQQDPPPAFSTYTASFYTAGNGAIVSHDPHLNEDGVYPVTYH